MHSNEIRDFIERAPAPRVFDGYRLLDMSPVRQLWLSEIFSGDIHSRINRRAGLMVHARPFYKQNPVFASVRRHARHLRRIEGILIPF